MGERYVMGIGEAKKYISQLHKKQGNPDFWPDFLTGLPDKTATIRKVNEVQPKLGRYSVTLLRIANVQPYLLKYGSRRHTEIIQWAAAILKTTMDRCGGFVGAYDTHDFIAVCGRKDSGEFLKEASRVFGKKIESFYTEEDLKKKNILSFKGEGRQVEVGIMELISVSAEEAAPGESVIPQLIKRLNELENR
jgi:hypothetical protein